MVAECFHEGADASLQLWGPGASCTYGWTIAPQHMGWYELRVALQSYEPSHQPASEGSRFITLAQSPGRLFVIPTPNNQAFAGNPCDGRGFIQVPVLLALIIEGNIDI